MNELYLEESTSLAAVAEMSKINLIRIHDFSISPGSNYYLAKDFLTNV